MANECIPFYMPEDVITATAAAALIGCRFCMVSGNRVGGGPELVTSGLGGNILVNYPAAGGRVFGVVAQDVAINQQIAIVREGVVPVLASGAIVAGGEVQTDATGRAVAKTTGIAVGFVIDVCADAELAQVALYEGFGAGGGSPGAGGQVALTPLTSAAGTPGAGTADVTGAFSQSILNNNFATLDSRVNAIEAQLVAAGIVA